MQKHLSFFLFFLFLFVAVSAQNSLQTIGSIEKRGVWYEIYNEQGKKIKTVQNNIGELIGFGAQFFIVKHGCWYHLYDTRAKKYKTLQTSIGEIISVASSSFTVRKGIWLYTYDSAGKKTGTRQAEAKLKKMNYTTKKMRQIDFCKAGALLPTQRSDGRYAERGIYI
jgi:hypothetical protein